MASNSNFKKMLYAIWTLDYPKIARMVDEGYDVNTPGLFVAICEKKIVPAIKLFLEHPNFIADDVIKNILTSSEDYQIDPEMLELILSYQNVRDTINIELNGITTFGHCVHNMSDLKIISIFLQNGADPNLGEISALEFACKKDSRTVFALRVKLELIKLLVTYGADLNARATTSRYFGIPLYGVIFSKSSRLVYWPQGRNDVEFLEQHYLLINFHCSMQPYLKKDGIYFTDKWRTVDQTVNFYREHFLEQNRINTLKETVIEHYSSRYFQILTEKYRIGNEDIIFNDPELCSITFAINNILSKNKPFECSGWQQILETNVVKVYTLLKDKLGINDYTISRSLVHYRFNRAFVQSILTFNVLSNSEDFFQNFAQEFLSFLRNLYAKFRGAKHINADNFVRLCQKININKCIVAISNVALDNISELDATIDQFYKDFLSFDVEFYRIIDGKKYPITVATLREFKISLQDSVCKNVTRIPFPVFPPKN